MTKVSIKALDKLHLENFWQQDPEDNEVYLLPDADPRRVSEMFRRAGLTYDADTQTIQFPGDPTPLPMTKVIGQVNYFKYLDGLTAGGNRGPADGDVDETEMAIALQEGAISAEELNNLDPEAFLESMRYYMDHYYTPLAREAEIYQAEQRFRPILQHFSTYSQGQYISSLRQAQEVLPLNGLTKSAANFFLLPATFTHNYILGNSWINKVIPLNRIKRGNGTEDAPLLMADALAKRDVELRYEHQTEVIDKFERGIKLALRLGQAWAFEGDLKKALDGLTQPIQAKCPVVVKGEDGKPLVRKDPKNGHEVIVVEEKDGERVTVDCVQPAQLSSEDRKILEETLTGKPYDNILHNTDIISQTDAKIAFAQGEGSKGKGIFRYGGGNATLDKTWYNYTGTSNNYYYMKSAFGDITSKSEIYTTYDPEEQGPITEEMLATGDFKLAPDGKTVLRLDSTLTEKYQAKTRRLEVEMFGTGGSFTNVVQSVLPDIGLEAWGNQEKDGALGRFALGVFVLIGGYKGIKWLGDAWTLRRIEGTPALFKTWWTEGSFVRLTPFAREAIHKARLAAEEIEAAQIASGQKLPRTWFGGRAWQRVKDAMYNKALGGAEKTLAKMGYVMSAGRKAQIALLAAKAPSRFATVVTDGALAVGIVYKADGHARAYTNPFKKNFEFSSAFGVDVTARDMILAGEPAEVEEDNAAGATDTTAPTP